MSTLNRLIAGPLGGFFLSPWYDPLAHAAIVRMYLPMSRAWARASQESGGIAADLHASYIAADQQFTNAVFGAGGDAAVAMSERTQAADDWMKARSRFWRQGLMRSAPPVRFEVESPAQVARRHGPRLADIRRAFHPSPVAIDVSCKISAADRDLSWLRYPGASPDGGEAWARVDAPPRGDAAGGTVVFLHGILMEREFFNGLYDYAPSFLSAAGGAMRLIQPEGPWHGRRMRPGWYGGEPLLGNPVGGLLDYFSAHVVEVGRLIAWARRVHGGPVAVAGVSLGALTTQLLISVARDWPAEAQPDAAMLITTNGSMIEVAFEGSLARSLDFPGQLQASGWEERALDIYRPLLEPSDLGLAPDRVVAVLGATDTVTPIAGGERLVERWQLPAANVFRRPGGHFSAAFSLLADDQPIQQLKRVMRAAA